MTTENKGEHRGTGGIAGTSPAPAARYDGPSPAICRTPGGARAVFISTREWRGVKIAFIRVCCDREAISGVATTGGIDSADIRDGMIESVERRFGSVNRLPLPIEWLSENAHGIRHARPEHYATPRSALVPARRRPKTYSPRAWPRPS
jgi:hypothetical protein